MYSRDRNQSDCSAVTLMSQHIEDTSTTNVSELQDIEVKTNIPSLFSSSPDVSSKRIDETMIICDKEIHDRFSSNQVEYKYFSSSSNNDVLESVTIDEKSNGRCLIALAVVTVINVIAIGSMALLMVFFNSEITDHISRTADAMPTVANNSNISDTYVGTHKEENNMPTNNDDAFTGLLAVIDQLTSKRRSVIHLESKSQSQKTGNINWIQRFAPQGDLTMSKDGRSIQVTTGGLYFIYGRVQFNRKVNVIDMRNLTFGFTLLRTNKDGIIIDRQDVKQPYFIQTVMLLEKEDKVYISVPEHQQMFWSRDSRKFSLGMFEL